MVFSGYNFKISTNKDEGFCVYTPIIGYELYAPNFNCKNLEECVDWILQFIDVSLEDALALTKLKAETNGSS